MQWSLVSENYNIRFNNMFKLVGWNLHDVDVFHTVLDKLTSIWTFYLEEKGGFIKSSIIIHAWRVSIINFVL